MEVRIARCSAVSRPQSHPTFHLIAIGFSITDAKGDQTPFGKRLYQQSITASLKHGIPSSQTARNQEFANQSPYQGAMCLHMSLSGVSGNLPITRVAWLLLLLYRTLGAPRRGYPLFVIPF